MSAVPARHNWKSVPLRHVCQLNPSVTFDGFGEDDDVTFLPMDRVKSGFFIQNTDKVAKNAPSYNAFEEGDILLAKVTPCFENGNIAVAENLVGGRGFGSSELFVIRPKNIYTRFLFYFLQSSAFKQEGEASMTGAGGLKRVSPDTLRQYHLLLPNEGTQRAIAHYLDRETARLDALVAAKERWLELLAEKRRALIARAVTRGLDPSALMRDSGIPWLGKVPAHWEVRRVATLFVQRDERNQPDLPLLEVSINSGVAIREFSIDKIESTASDFNTYKVARRGDIAFNKMRMWQGAVGVAPVDGLVSPDYTVAELNGELQPEYAEQVFRTQAFSAECGRHSQGITWDRLRLYWDGFRDIFMPLPPLDEQQAIIEHIATETAKIDRLRAAAERSIVLLKERRAALIAAAVTGQIDIPEAA